MNLSLLSRDRGRLERKLLEVEIRALEDLTAGDERTFDTVVERQSATEVQAPPSSAQPVALISAMTEQYLDQTGRGREWPQKTILRKRGELREFLEIVGDKPVNQYTREDGQIQGYAAYAAGLSPEGPFQGAGSCGCGQ